ncbi:c-type cytochrome, partial [Burkholderia multivorans]
MALVVLLLVGLLLTGGAYALFTQTSSANASTTASASDIEEGKKLFAANCATCHGLNAEGTKAGPGLIGVGAAAVDFQVGTGRMPLQANGPQARVKEPQF